MADNPVVEAGGDLLQRKYGPLPFWGWLVIAGGTAFVVRKYLNNRSTTADASQEGVTSTSDGTDTDTGGLGGYNFPGAPLSNGGGGNTGGYDPVSGGNDTDPLIAWQQKAVAAVVDKGVAGPVDASSALRKWLGSQPLTPKEKAIADEAVALVGVPPTGLPNNPVVDNTVTTPTAGKSTPSQITIQQLGAPPNSTRQSLAIQGVWISNGKPVSDRSLELQESLDNAHWYVRSRIRTDNNGVAKYVRPISVKGKGYLRFSVPVTDTTYHAARSGVVAWNVNK